MLSFPILSSRYPLWQSSANTGRIQFVLDDIARGLLEGAVERRLEQVEIVYLLDAGTRHDPEADALLPPAKELPRVVRSELPIRREDIPRMPHRLPLPLLPEHFIHVHHA